MDKLNATKLKNEGLLSVRFEEMTKKEITLYLGGVSIALFGSMLEKTSDEVIEKIIVLMALLHRSEMEIYCSVRESLRRVSSIIVKYKVELGQENLFSVKLGGDAPLVFSEIAEDSHFLLPDIWKYSAVSHGFANVFAAREFLYDCFKCKCESHYDQHEKLCSIAIVSVSPKDYRLNMEEEEQGDFCAGALPQVGWDEIPYGLNVLQVVKQSAVVDLEQAKCRATESLMEIAKIPDKGLSGIQVSVPEHVLSVPVCPEVMGEETKEITGVMTYPHVTMTFPQVVQCGDDSVISYKSKGGIDVGEGGEPFFKTFITYLVDDPRVELNDKESNRLILLIWDYISKVGLPVPTVVLERGMLPTVSYTAMRIDSLLESRPGLFRRSEIGWEIINMEMRCLRSIDTPMSRLCRRHHAHSLWTIVHPLYHEAYWAGKKSRNEDVVLYRSWLEKLTCVPFCLGRLGNSSVVNSMSYVVNAMSYNEPYGVVGAKIIFWTSRGYYVFKDKNKLLDLIGGRINVGESFRDAALREFHEETGRTLFRPIEYATSTGSREDGVLYLTHLFHCYGAPREKGFHFYPYGIMPMSSQPWLRRHLLAWSFYHAIICRVRRGLDVLRPFY